MGHSHGHYHSHDHFRDVSLNRVFIVSIALNLTYVIVEAVVGFAENSMSLLSDAGHNLSDVFALLLAMIAFRLAALPVTKRFSYGYKKSTVLISLLNAIILLVAVSAIVLESIRKFSVCEAIDGSVVSWTAAAGILVNGLTAWLLMRSQKSDLNVRGAFLHMLADTLVSVGVVISGIIITITGWSLIDPIVSLIIAVVILVTTWQLLAESIRLSIDATPKGIDPDKVKQALEEDESIVDVHHVHIWPISTTETALTAHIVIRCDADMEQVKDRSREILRKMDIMHSTLELELEGTQCHSPAHHGN